MSSGGQDIQSLAPQITYSWNNVTVYAEKKQKITSRFNPLNKGKNTGPKQKLILKNGKQKQKLILKNGKFFSSRKARIRAPSRK